MSSAGQQRRMIVPVILVVSLTTAAGAVAGEYHVDTSAARRVVFVSEAPIESFEGVTDRIDGFVFFPFEALHADSSYDGSQFYFEVDLNALDTGIGLRNRHMRENYLHTGKYPYASYTGRIESVSRLSDSTFLVSCAGNMTIHGETRELATTDTVTVIGNRYRIATGFAIRLPDYNIEIPKLMFLKINEMVELNLSFAVRPAGGPAGGVE